MNGEMLKAIERTLDHGVASLYNQRRLIEALRQARFFAAGWRRSAKALVEALSAFSAPDAHVKEVAAHMRALFKIAVVEVERDQARAWSRRWKRVAKDVPSLKRGMHKDALIIYRMDVALEKAEAMAIEFESDSMSVVEKRSLEAFRLALAAVRKGEQNG